MAVPQFAMLQVTPRRFCENQLDNRDGIAPQLPRRLKVACALCYTPMAAIIGSVAASAATTVAVNAALKHN